MTKPTVYTAADPVRQQQANSTWIQTSDPCHCKVSITPTFTHSLSFVIHQPSLSGTHAVWLPPVSPQQHPLGAVCVSAVCCRVSITTSQVSQRFP